MSDIVVRILGSLSVIHKVKSPERANFFSLPGALQSFDDNVLVPRVPALMQTSQQVRSEFSKIYQPPILIKCQDYASFFPWSQGIGLCVIGNIYEIHLSIKVYVNVVSKSHSLESGRLADLQVRFNAARTHPGYRQGPSARFWFNIADEPKRDHLDYGRPYYSGDDDDYPGNDDNHTGNDDGYPDYDYDYTGYDYDDGTRWFITPSEIDRLSQEFEARLPWDREFNSVDILQLTHWLSGDGVIDFDDPDSSNFKGGNRWNTFRVKDREGTRAMEVMVFPPGSCDGCTQSLNLWRKPLAIADVSSQSCSTLREQDDSPFDEE